MCKVFEVTIGWDEEAGVWLATSEDVPGLCAEAGSFDELMREVELLVPELLALNGIVHEGDVPLHVVAERSFTVSASA